MPVRLRTIFFMNLGHTYDHLLMLLYPTVVLALEKEFAASYAQLLALSTWSFVAFAVGTLPSGWLGDRWSRRNMMIVFFLGMGVSCMAIGLATEPTGIAIGLAVMGLFGSIYHPVGISIVAGAADEKTLGRAMGVNGVFGNLGVALAAIIAGTLVEYSGWRTAFVVPGAACVLTGIAYWAFAPAEAPTAKAKAKRTVAISRADQIRVFWVVVVATLFGGIIFQTTTVGLPKLFDERLAGLVNTTSGIGGWVFVVFAVAAVAQILVGHLLDKGPLKPVFIGSGLLQAPLLFIAAYSAGWPMLAVAMAMMFTVFGVIPIHDVIVARYTSAEWRSRIYAAKYVLTFGVSAAAVPLIAGLHAWTGSFQAVLLVLVGAALVYLLAALSMPGRRAIAVQPAQAPAE